MPQRLAAPEWQPALVARLHPLAKLLSVKRSQRCRACDHNLTKPEYNPGSIKFKIELLAYYHVPEVKIISYETIKAGCKSTLLLKLSNPTPHEMTLRLLQPEEVPDEEDPDSKDTSLEKSLDKSLKIEKFQPEPRRSPRPGAPTVSAAAPDAALTLAPRDDAAEYDDDARDESSHIIVWRKSNKLALRLELSAEGAAPGPARAALGLQYSYRNTVPQPGPPQSQDHTLHTVVYLDLGTVAAADPSL